MAATKATKASPVKKGEAARAEKKGASKEVNFRGLKLPVPSKIPGTLLWDFNELLSGGDRSLGGFIDLLDSLVGAENNRAIRNKVGEEGLGLEETIGALEELLNEIFEVSGLSLGE